MGARFNDSMLCLYLSSHKSAKFEKIIKDIDAAGALKEGTNTIRTVVNGFKTEIRVHISQGEVLNINGFVEYSDRKWDNEIYWP